MYIAAKYENLREEILNNKICNLDKETFDIQVHLKATNVATTKHVKETTPRYGAYLSNVENTYFYRYGFSGPWEWGRSLALMTADHISSIILYCGFTTLSYEFSKTFRKIDESEDIETCKQRNREYAHLSKLLLETVNIFGYVGNKECPKYYTGINNAMIFNSFSGSFSSPTSTSAQIEVAWRFAGVKGIVLHLRPMDNSMNYFNCSWLSCFSEEDERLVFAPYYPVTICSIQDLGLKMNYKWYIEAILKLYCAVNYTVFELKDSKKQNKIIHKLISGKKK
eukprot:119243_1